MPILSPAGPLATLDELVAEFASLGSEDREKRHTDPVFILNKTESAGEDRTTVESRDDESVLSPRADLPSVVVPARAKRFSADPSRIVIGRSSVCDVVLPFAAISKVHAYLGVLSPTTWQIEDAGSTNGTLVDGLRLKGRQKAVLRDGATVDFGKVMARFVLAATFRHELMTRGPRR
jgi:hypothetical protein